MIRSSSVDLLHILPPGFVCIRHYGILSLIAKKAAILCIREQFSKMEISFIDMRKTKSFDPKICPCCGNPTMVAVEKIPSRGPSSDGKLPNRTIEPMFA
jgi:hypothetical protein